MYANRDGRNFHRGSGGGRHRGRRHGRAGLREGSVLSRAELRLLLLSLFGDEPRHGYELIRLVKMKTRGAYAPSPGMVYPVLAELAEAGAITETPGEGERRSYRIAPAGSDEATARTGEIEELNARLAALSTAAETTHAPIARALANLELVLGNALANADATRVDAIVERIDQMAREIERQD